MPAVWGRAERRRCCDGSVCTTKGEGAISHEGTFRSSITWTSGGSTNTRSPFRGLREVIKIPPTNFRVRRARSLVARARVLCERDAWRMARQRGPASPEVLDGHLGQRVPEGASRGRGPDPVREERGGWLGVSSYGGLSRSNRQSLLGSGRVAGGRTANQFDIRLSRSQRNGGSRRSNQILFQSTALTAPPAPAQSPIIRPPTRTDLRHRPAATAIGYPGQAISAQPCRGPLPGPCGVAHDAPSARRPARGLLRCAHCAELPPSLLRLATSRAKPSLRLGTRNRAQGPSRMRNSPRRFRVRFALSARLETTGPR